MTTPLIDLSKYSLEELDKLRRANSMALAPQLPFSAEGYKHHYGGIFSHTLPSFAWDWVQEFFEFYDKGVRRFGFKAHRGATKSTVWTIGFSTYILATHPAEGILIVQKSDTAGGKTSSAIAGVIKSNVGWQTMYPHLQADDKQKWAFEGYEIVDTRIPYNEWRQKVLDERPKDNSFVAYGWSNGGIVGMHPRWLFVDDILDEENTRSKREMGAVKATMNGNVLQTLNRPPEWDDNWKEPTAIFSYTPWYADDYYAHIESTGLYHVMETPLASEAEPTEKGAFEWRGKHWVCAWEVKNPAKLMDAKVQEWGEMDFQRMQMLDLTKAEGINLKREWLHEFEYEKIKDNWPVYIGVDYASSADKLKMGNNDYYALAIGRGIPGGGIVLVDGYRAKLSQGESEEKLKTIASLYGQYLSLIGFEKLGKGYDSGYNLSMNTGLPIVLCPREGEGKRGKGDRFEGSGGLGHLFQFSRAWISDLETPFLKAFREEWASWPNGKNDDTLDAVYWMCYVAQGLLIPPPENEELGRRKERQPSPFATLGKKLAEAR